MAFTSSTSTKPYSSSNSSVSLKKKSKLRFLDNVLSFLAPEVQTRNDGTLPSVCILGRAH